MGTTTTVDRKLSAATPAAYDRIFYSSMAISMALVVLVGFGPTFYFRSFFDAPLTVSGSAELTTMTRLHGALFSMWVLLFIVQTALVAGRRVAVHRRMGVAGVVLAAAMVVVGVSTAISAAARGSAPPGADALTFLVVPLVDLVLFAGFIVAAVRARRNKEVHKRLMLLAYVSIIAAAVARLPGVLPFGPLMFFGLSYIFLLIAMVYDRTTRGRIHPVYIWGGALLVLSVPLRLAISTTTAWRSLAERLVAG